MSFILSSRAINRRQSRRFGPRSRHPLSRLSARSFISSLLWPSTTRRTTPATGPLRALHIVTVYRSRHVVDVTVALASWNLTESSVEFCGIFWNFIARRGGHPRNPLALAPLSWPESCERCRSSPRYRAARHTAGSWALPCSSGGAKFSYTIPRVSRHSSQGIDPQFLCEKLIVLVVHPTIGSLWTQLHAPRGIDKILELLCVVVDALRVAWVGIWVTEWRLARLARTVSGERIV